MNDMNIPDSSLPRVVVLGAGFAGLALVKNLKKQPFQVVLIDKNNYHNFQPLMYQVATAGLESDSIAYPIRKIFKRQNDVHFRLAEVERIYTDKNMLQTSTGQLEYDYLVIASGSKTNYFGNKRIEALSMPMKTIPEALNLRSLILQNFEDSLLTKNLKERERLMNYVIVGGGPTGVELAGALAELKLQVLPRDYPELDLRRMSVHLLEASDRLLNAMNQESSNSAYKFLADMHVNVWLNTAVKDYDGETVITSKRDLPAKTLIWAAGVTGCFPKGLSEAAISRGRLIVDEFNKVEGHSNIFAIGDVAFMPTAEKPKGDPMLAQTALQHGKQLAKNLKNMTKNAPMKPFLYKDWGSMATVGRNRAVVDMKNFKSQGFIAWYIWMFVHLMSLVGFRNRLVALANWAVAYVSYDRGIRLIIRPFKRKELKETDAGVGV